MLVTQDQKKALLDTMAQYNAACNVISKLAQEENTYGQYDLHHTCYHLIREQFPALSANHVVRAIARVSASYKLLNKNEKKAYVQFKKGETDRWYRELRTFKWRNSIELDARLWGFLRDGTITISSAYGRIKHIYWMANKHNQNLLRHRTDSSALVYRRGGFYLHVVCDIQEKPEQPARDFIGIDMGVVNIATTSDGEIWSSDKIEFKRQWYAWRKAQLQQVGTDSAKRRLVKLSGRESRFKGDVDHCISKHIVTDAERTGRGIAIENLKGINQRTRAIRKGQRAKHHSWSFCRLGTYIGYKAKLRGVPVVVVDPRYTSQMCSNCGHVAKNNRSSQSQFSCRSCNFNAHADYNASLNIRNRAIQQAYGELDSQAP